MFRAIEAIIKYFNAYLEIDLGDSDIDRPIGECYAIKSYNKFLRENHIYHLVNWEFVAEYFNKNDDKEIRDVYSLDRFSLNS